MDLSLNKLPWYAQVGIFVLLSLGAVGGFYYTYASQMMDDISAREQKFEQLRAEIRKGQATARTLPQFRAQVTSLENRLESLKAVLPEEKDYGDLLHSVQTLATQSNLIVKLFKPDPTVTKQLYSEWPIHLELDGTYHNLGLFFDRISKFPRIINIKDITIKAKDKAEPNSTITADCVAVTFVLVDSAKAPAVPAAPRPPLPVAKVG